MAPKAKARSKSPKKKIGGDLDADPEADAKKAERERKRREKELEDEERARRYMEANKPPPVPYDGPRPDEEFIQAVKAELDQGKYAKEAIEEVYALHRTGNMHRLQDDEPIGPERLLTVDVNQRSFNGYSSLHIASAAGDPKMVSLLLERRADVAVRTVHRSEIALHFVAQAGHDVCARLLIDPSKAKGLLNAANVTGWTPLHLALVGHHMTVMAMLLRAGADINGRNVYLGGCTALHVAARMGFQEGIESLLDRDADPKAADNLQQTALHFSARRAEPKAVSLLLRCKADAGSAGPGRPTPLDLVPKEHACREKVMLLLQAYMRPPPLNVRTDPHFEHEEDRRMQN